MMTDENRENFVPLSKSPIWDLQRSFYENLGIEAWAPSRVPNYVTTNPFIARSYGKVIGGFFEDFAVGSAKGRQREPHYIIELGAGSGRFAYSFLRHFFARGEASVRRKRDIIYVMTDISEANIEYWRRHPQLKPFIDQGVLDFAYLDATKDHPVKLLISERKIAPGSLSNPLAVIGNYVIDSIPHDLYSVQNGRLMARKVCHRIGTESDEIEEIVRSTEFEYQEEPAATAPYENQLWNRVLEKYRTVKGGINFSFPVGGLKAIDRLAALTTGPMFWLAGDFGASDMSVLKEMPPRKIARNGTFSLHVNFHSLGEYVKLRKGRFFSPGHAKSSLEMAGFLMNPGRRKTPHLTHGFDSHIRDVGPDEFFMLKKIAEMNFGQHSLPQMLALLRMSYGDIKIFRGCQEALRSELPTATAQQRQSVIEAMMNVDDAFFRCDHTPDPAFPILRMMMELGAKKEAEELLERNRGFLGETSEGTLLMAEVGALKSA